MKKAIFLIAFLLFIVFTLPVYSVKPPSEPEPTKAILSAFIEITLTDPGPKTMHTVSADKLFILTDIVVNSNYDRELGFWLMEETTVKLQMGFDTDKNDTKTRSFHFNSGIPFAPGTNVIINGSPGQFTISGYETDIP